MISKFPFAAVGITCFVGLTSLVTTGCNGSSKDQPLDAALPDASVEAGCVAACDRAATCGVPISPDECLSSCRSADDAARACVAACATVPCDQYMTCVNECAHSGTGDPYGSDSDTCGDDASADQPCAGSSIVCEVNRTPDGSRIHSLCTPFCNPDPCPIPATGTAVPLCDTTANPSTCTLDCSAGQTCPDGMECFDDRCYWRVK